MAKKVRKKELVRYEKQLETGLTRWGPLRHNPRYKEAFQTEQDFVGIPFDIMQDPRLTVEKMKKILEVGRSKLIPENVGSEDFSCASSGFLAVDKFKILLKMDTAMSRIISDKLCKARNLFTSEKVNSEEWLKSWRRLSEDEALRLCLIRAFDDVLEIPDLYISVSNEIPRRVWGRSTAEIHKLGRKAVADGKSLEKRKLRGLNKMILIAVYGGAVSEMCNLSSFLMSIGNGTQSPMFYSESKDGRLCLLFGNYLILKNQDTGEDRDLGTLEDLKKLPKEERTRLKEKLSDEITLPIDLRSRPDEIYDTVQRHIAKWLEIRRFLQGKIKHRKKSILERLLLIIGKKNMTDGELRRFYKNTATDIDDLRRIERRDRQEAQQLVKSGWQDLK